jgi:hypothetical protein
LTLPMTKIELEQIRKDFLLTDCSMGIMELAMKLHSGAPKRWEGIDFRMGVASSTGLEFWANGQHIEAKLEDTDLVRIIHGAEDKRFVYQRRLEPTAEGDTIDDCIFKKPAAKFSPGWYRGEGLLKPRQIVDEMIETSLGLPVGSRSESDDGEDDDDKPSKFPGLVVVRFQLSGDMFGEESERAYCLQLEDKITAEIDKLKIGQWDGHEFGCGECNLYFQCIDVDACIPVIQEVLGRERVPTGSYLVSYPMEHESEGEKIKILAESFEWAEAKGMGLFSPIIDTFRAVASRLQWLFEGAIK